MYGSVSFKSMVWILQLSKFDFVESHFLSLTFLYTFFLFLCHLCLPDQALSDNGGEDNMVGRLCQQKANKVTFIFASYWNNWFVLWGYLFLAASQRIPRWGRDSGSFLSLISFFLSVFCFFFYFFCLSFLIVFSPFHQQSGCSDSEGSEVRTTQGRKNEAESFHLLKRF